MDSETKVLRLFFDNPTRKFHIREIARVTELNPNTILTIIENLSKRGLLIREKKKHIVEVSANVSYFFKELKKIDNLKRIYESKIVNFLEKEKSNLNLSGVMFEPLWIIESSLSTICRDFNNKCVAV